MRSIREPGVVLLNSAAGFELEMINRLKHRGSHVCALDEEGLVHPGDGQERVLRFSQTTLDALDSVFFNGAIEHDLMCDFYDVDPTKIKITGNPRFDFYKPEFRHYYQAEANLLRNKLGAYLFIPSRFGEVNMATNDDFIAHLVKLNYTDKQFELDHFRGFLSHSQRVYDAFIDLLPHLARAFPERTIVVRPHPSESPLGWIRAAQGLDNVRVINEGPIGPWLLGAAAVLHNGCTTGLEAFLMDRPVFSYMPYTSVEFDLPLPNSVSICHATPGTLIPDLAHAMQCVERVTNERSNDIEARYAYASRHLENASRDVYAYAKIAEALCHYARDLPDSSQAALRNPIYLRSRNFVRKIRGYLAIKLFGTKLHSHRLFGDGYSYRKNPGLTTREILGNFRRLSRPTNLSVEGITLRKLDEDMFLVTKSKLKNP